MSENEGSVNYRDPGLPERLDEFNDQFDYGEYHGDREFWLALLEHQSHEAMESLEGGDLAHILNEAADSILVAWQILYTFGEAPPEMYVRHRANNAEKRGIDAVCEKYIQWWESRNDRHQHTGS